MHKLSTALCLLSAAALFQCMQAAETWTPQDHPASIKRVLHGFTEASHHMFISSEVSALVKDIPVDIGDRIKDAQFITLDDRLAQIDLRLAQHQEQQAQHQIQNAKANLSIAESLQRYRLAEKNRSSSLIEKNVASDEQHQAMLFQHEQAQLAIANQQILVEDAQQQLGIAQAQTQRAQLLLERHQIRLPTGWSVSQRLVQVNSLVQPGTPLLELINTQSLIIRYNLNEEEIQSLRKQEQLHIHLQQTAKPIPVTIKSISPSFDPVSRKRSVELQAEASLFPEASGGLACSLTLSLPDPNSAVFIPKSFLNERFEQFRVQSSDKSWHPIIIMRDEGKHVVIQSSQLPDNCVLQIPELD